MKKIMHTIIPLLLIGVFFIPTILFAETTTPAATTEPEVLENALTPDLSVEVPGVSFSKILNNDGVLEVNFIADYISGMYTYLIGFGTTIAIVLIMIGGLQYSLGGMASGQVQKGKERIRNAVIGLALLLATVLILFNINPQTTILSSLNLLSVEAIELNYAAGGLEGGMDFIDRAICDEIVATAKSEGSCNISGTVGSPTGTQPNCGRHHWFDRGTNGDYKKIRNMDYAAPWDQEILAPITGTVKYVRWDNNMCGNEIRITGTGEYANSKISICHAKDFVAGDGTFQNGRHVEVGDVVGHLGGNCCAGENPPASWDGAKHGWCDVGGTPCTDPESRQSCDCQDWKQAGNTTGPHVHMTWYASGGDLLACLQY